MQPYGQGGHSPSMRASDADRERTVDVLRAGFAEGRLSKVEYDERVGLVFRAQTYGELHRLVGDLPQGPLPGMGAPGYGPSRFGMQMPLPPPVRKTNSTATASLILGVLSPMTCGVTGIPAAITGHVARREIRRTGEGGEGMALAGIILGWLTVASYVLVILAAILDGM
ncbi:DUF1707 and DUF4190 domain-containing protein [Streptomyces polyrhachis]|uniref:DUF1707 and DUF4190 domain-containing protein n=1 Tax=Streptomyces polyrhachis TaxID=1282885 RepID=A0ABW2GFW5_9ACTN